MKHFEKVLKTDGLFCSNAKAQKVGVLGVQFTAHDN